MRIAFAGLRHGHIFDIARIAEETAGTEIAGAWEENDAAREAAKDRFGYLYPDYESLLADPDVDIVAVGDYYGIRGERILRALRAGKHVISDKPVCTSLADLDAIERACAETGCRLGCQLDLRYDGAIRTAEKLVRAGEIGEVKSVAFTGQHPLNYGVRPGWYFEKGKHGGTFNDIAIHGIDAVATVTGQRPAKVLLARQWNSYAVETPGFADSAQLMAELENGAALMADVSYSAPSGAAFRLPSYWRFTFWGTKGWIECRLGDDHVLLAQAGDADVRTVPALPSVGNALETLLREIAGETEKFGTNSVIASARDVLRIQRAADEGNADRC